MNWFLTFFLVMVVGVAIVVALYALVTRAKKRGNVSPESTDALCPRTPAVFKVWKTIKIGTLQADELQEAIQERGYKITDYALEVLQDTFYTSTKEATIDLVLLTAKELGFDDEDHSPTNNEMCTRAFELGLHLCSAEDGLQLRLQYPDQPYGRGDEIYVGMSALHDEIRRLAVFCIYHDNSGLCLDASGGPYGPRVTAQSRWVFVLPKDRTPTA